MHILALCREAGKDGMGVRSPCWRNYVLLGRCIPQRWASKLEYAAWVLGICAGN